MQYSKPQNIKNKKNRIIPFVVLFVACLLLIYCVASVFMFITSFKNSNNDTATTVGNIQFTVSELFNISDYNSTGATVLLFIFCTFSIASLVAIIVCIVKTEGKTIITIPAFLAFAGELFSGIYCYKFLQKIIVAKQNNMELAVSTVVLTIVLALVAVALIFAIIFMIKANSKKHLISVILALVLFGGLLIGAFATYEIYQIQLNLFKEGKDISLGATNDMCKDENGLYYLIDSNGSPYMAFEIDDETISTEDYTSFSSMLNQSDIDTLYLQCDYTLSDGSEKDSITKEDKITIDNVYYLDENNKKINIEISDVTEKGDTAIHYNLTCNNITIRYKLISASDYDRTDPDAMTTFLIVGKDRVALNTDVMILISLKEESGNYTANILQVPRDTYNRISYNGKINAVYSKYYDQSNAKDDVGKITDGMEGLVETLETNWCMKIDYWAIMDLEGFSDIVDGIGGVSMYVPFDMYYSDASAEPPLLIDLKEGRQTLNGDQAEQFIRFRKGYLTGDLGRMDATKLFLTAFFCSMRQELSITNPTALTNTVSTLLTYVTSDLDAGNAVYYLKKVLKLNLEDITFLSMPGNSVTTTASYYTINRNGLYYIINNYFNVYDTDIDKSSFDSSKMFTAPGESDINSIYKSYFDEEDYLANLKDAEDIKDDNEGDNEMINKMLK